MKKQIRELEKKILAFINNESDDVGFKRLREEAIEGVQIGKHEILGLLWKKLYLRNLKDLCGSADDDSILSSLENLARGGKLRVFWVGTTPAMRFDDIALCVELGTVRRDITSPDESFTVLRFYCQTPLKKSERDEHTILDIKARVRRIEQERDELFSQRYGQTNPEIEKELLLADLEAQSEQRRHLRKIAGWIDEKRTLQ